MALLTTPLGASWRHSRQSPAGRGDSRRPVCGGQERRGRRGHQDAGYGQRRLGASNGSAWVLTTVEMIPHAALWPMALATARRSQPARRPLLPSVPLSSCRPCACRPRRTRQAPFEPTGFTMLWLAGAVTGKPVRMVFPDWMGGHRLAAHLAAATTVANRAAHCRCVPSSRQRPSQPAPVPPPSTDVRLPRPSGSNTSVNRRAFSTMAPPNATIHRALPTWATRGPMPIGGRQTGAIGVRSGPLPFRVKALLDSFTRFGYGRVVAPG